MSICRCGWAGENPIYVEYHDRVWGRPLRDEQKLFELLVLECMQAGLSWLTVLKKRESFREAFDDFDYEKIALYDEKKVVELLSNEKIIRNRLKIDSAISNAKIFIKVRKEYGSFSDFIWGYVENKPVVNSWKKIEDLPARTELSDRISKDLKRLGFKFVGSTIIYAFMQSSGMVNDHIMECFVRDEIMENDKN